MEAAKSPSKYKYDVKLWINKLLLQSFYEQSIPLDRWQYR